MTKRRSPSEKSRDRRVIGDMYLKGYMQAEIAERLSRSIAFVGHELRYLHQEWLDKGMHDFDTAKSIELAKLDALEREYWKGWVASCQDEETVKVKRVEYVADSGATEKVETTTVRRGQSGNSKFLDGIGNCIALRCKIFGLEINKNEMSVSPTLGEILRGLPDVFRGAVVKELEGRSSGSNSNVVDGTVKKR